MKHAIPQTRFPVSSISNQQPNSFCCADLPASHTQKNAHQMLCFIFHLTIHKLTLLTFPVPLYGIVELNEVNAY